MSIDKRPIQAIVFYFNRDSGAFFLESYGRLDFNHMMDTELSLINRSSDNQIMRDIRLLKVTNYYSIYEDALYCNEIDECDLELENDSLGELMLLKAYALFQEAFLNIDLNYSLFGVQMIYPFYSYIQEHDGGYSNLLNILENNHNA
ncbi:MAG: hypothetical protein ACRBFS_18070 [Aureispira sp.]